MTKEVNEWTQLLFTLQLAGVKKVYAGFDGYGDSGEVTSITFLDKNDYGMDVSHLELHGKSIEGVMDKIVDKYLDTWIECDWWNNDGGFGEIVLDVDSGVITSEANTRYTETRLEETYRHDLHEDPTFMTVFKGEIQ